jgi:hypothetical protein
LPSFDDHDATSVRDGPTEKRHQDHL